MYLARVHIDGYGIFSNFGLPADSEGQTFSKNLTVVIGPNESGKSTLLSFLRSILFGFLKGSSGDNPYPPIAGGRHGGLVTLVDSQGVRYVVARSAGSKGGLVRVTMPDGSTAGSDELDELLGHASRELFKNVFAFGLSELQDFKTLTSDEVSARIYSAGIGAGRLSINDIENKLERMRGELFTTDRASSKQIMALLDKCADLRQRLVAMEGQASEYVQLQEDLRTLNDRIDGKRKTRDDKRNSLDHCDNLLRAWQPWTEMQEAKERLSELPAVDGFPIDGISRLEVVLERIRSEKKKIESKQTEIDGLEKDLTNIKVNQQLLDRITEMTSIERGLVQYVSAKEDLPKIQVELGTQNEDLKRGLANLGPGWDEQRVLDFDTSISARETIRNHDSCLAARRQQLQAAARSAGQISESLDDAKQDLQRLKENLDNTPEPSEHEKAVVEARLRHARTLLAGLTDYRVRLQERDALQERSSDKKTYATSIQRQLAQNAETLRLPIAITILLCLVPIVGWLVLYYLRRTSSRLQKQNDSLENDLRETRTELKNMLDRISSIENEIQSEEDRLKSAALSAGLQGIASATETSDLIASLDDDLAKLVVWQAASDKVSEGTELVAGLERNFQAAEEARRQAEEEMAQAEREWKDWLEKREIITDCLPPTALEILSRVESAREKVENMVRTRERVKGIEESMSRYENATNAVLNACGDMEVTRPEFPGAADKLIDRWKMAQRENERLERMQQDMARNVKERDGFQKALESAEKDLAQLLSEAAAEDEGSFRQRHRVSEEAARLTTVIDQRRKTLEQIAGRKEALEAFVSELESTTPEKLKDTRRAVDEERQALEEELELAIDERRGIKDKLEKLERTQEASALRLQLNVLQEKLKVRALEWVSLTVGQNLLREARTKYERERKPAVVQQGQHFFSMITSHRYPRLISPPGETQIQLEDSTGHRKQLAELSRGTAEQLYLALRFGLIREFSRHSESLPVVMDDILVNFDPQRAKEAARAIAELANDNQVIVFTCHPNTADLLTAQAPQALVMKLQYHQD
jgi:uncharacterized protein YhaN